ncbi:MULTISPECIES: phosphoribosyl-AMP cyclohydrolase [Sinorhizobium/Ensifer group]|jgi:phosphoribosyl-AMP cyclohydrolase|uniref:phosphoribosyl-AMP cyclohydrolase n=1 Tax=Sinorhizobium/Ensifer group TaxID=227292 RepID=UPI00071D38D1|nr:MULTISPECIES: phosphoribosyl-AMP cyclohydrolase [Sinorhizobium/Ensifer group]KSV68381.1 phosphoribosyl-AMP cyclohydrolase [Sinorhizobium sp. Sb3]KSV95197.1 phosphoribosyl-AMP cyclohydrolase [Sinorhizobium sp. GL28]MBD9510223.1 phosphoribosyl-AMP cyclohydrolase [Ensifer sp. ENS10]MBV7520740.1 phosphoribosyl-AMP cyclohydrolase [Ensifer sp. ENS12]SDA52475.1 phosphoribosyl-AMP cyclohydrolase [Sinorhizobium sp. NFACC03]
MTLTFDAPSSNKAELETGPAFTPRFDEKGLITAVVTDARDGELLMVAHMNAEALALTIETGVAHYYSRSRKSLWKKGESSGNLQTVKEIRTDCDQDAIWLKVSVAGHDATCHTGRRSCFYRTVGAENGKAMVEITDDHRHFDPAEIYDKN